MRNGRGEVCQNKVRGPVCMSPDTLQKVVTEKGAQLTTGSIPQHITGYYVYEHLSWSTTSHSLLQLRKYSCFFFFGCIGLLTSGHMQGDISNLAVAKTQDPHLTTDEPLGHENFWTTTLRKMGYQQLGL